LIVIHNSSIRNIALHDLTLIKMIVARFVGTGNFLDILLYEIHMSPIQEVPRRYLTKHYNYILKSKLVYTKFIDGSQGKLSPIPRDPRRIIYEPQSLCIQLQ